MRGRQARRCIKNSIRKPVVPALALTAVVSGFKLAKPLYRFAKRHCRRGAPPSRPTIPATPAVPTPAEHESAPELLDVEHEAFPELPYVELGLDASPALPGTLQKPEADNTAAQQISPSSCTKVSQTSRHASEAAPKEGILGAASEACLDLPSASKLEGHAATVAEDMSSPSTLIRAHVANVAEVGTADVGLTGQDVHFEMQVLQGCNGRYSFHPERDYLGGGAFGKVFRATHLESCEIVAIKVVSTERIKDEAIRVEQAKLEGKILRWLADVRRPHPCILGFRDSFTAKVSLPGHSLAGSTGSAAPAALSPVDESICIVTELADSALDELMREKRGLRTRKVKDITYQLASGLDFMHRHEVSHRDIKPGNVLLKGSKAIIADFGLAQLGPKHLYKSPPLGTLAFAAPEVLLGEKVTGEAADIWALGCTVFAMLMGHSPYSTAMLAAMDSSHKQKPDGLNNVRQQWQILRHLIGDDKRPELDKIYKSKSFQSAAPGVSLTLRERLQLGGVKDETLIRIIEACLQLEASQRITAGGIMDFMDEVE